MEVNLEMILRKNQFLRLLFVTNVIFLIITGSLQSIARNITQTITLNKRDARIEKIFKDIEEQSGYSFLYNNNQIKEAKLVTINVNHATLEQALASCFKDQPFGYIIVDNLIIVKSREHLSAIGYSLSDKIFPIISIKGRAVDEKGEPIGGVTVSVKGSSKATFTNLRGEFLISDVESNSILVFTGANIEYFEISIHGKTEIQVGLTTKVSKLDEVQVIAYGTTTKRLNTGNVYTVKEDDIKKQPVGNPLLCLEGRVPGLFITQSNGLPGSGVTAIIQGKNSLIKGNDPLYVIDGVPYPSQMLPTVSGGPLGGSGGATINGAGLFGGSPLSYITPNDIESIEVLKDADATAIYGSMAANGAILITTKKAKSGPLKVDINLQNGFGKVTHKFKLLDAKEYLVMRKEAIKNDNATVSSTDYDLNGFWDTTKNTNWQNVLIGGAARYQDVSTSVSGGNSSVRFLIGGNYHNETTVFPGNFSDKIGSIHFNMRANSLNQKFSIQLSGSFASNSNSLFQYDGTLSAIQLSPIAPSLFNPDGSLNWMPTSSGNSTFSNPLASFYNTYRNKTNNLLGSALISYNIAPGLDIKCTAGYNNLNTNEIYASPLTAVRPENRPTATRTAIYSNSSIATLIIEPLISYTRNLGKSKVETLVGGTIRKNISNGVSLVGIGYNSDAVLDDIAFASSITANSALVAHYRYNALFGRLNYNVNNKYILNLNFRRDGSSRFGSNNQFHDFYSVGGAWVFTEENFFKKNLSSIISFGKIRGSYGTTGNDQIGDYQFLNLFNPFSVGVPYQNVTGLRPSGLPNPYLQWEETKKFQVGFEMGIYKERVLLNANYSINRSSNQLISYSLPSITGFTSIAENFPATIQNENWEFSLNTINIRNRGFTWESNINFTIPENKLVRFPNIERTSYSSLLTIGKPFTILKAYHAGGVDPAIGLYEFSDVHGNPTFSPSSTFDKTFVLNTSSEYYGGLANSVSYNNMQLEFLFQYVKQIGLTNVLFNGSAIPGQFNGGYGNQSIEVLNRWQRPGDISEIQKYTQNSSNSTRVILASGSSDYGYSDASYIRLKNISFSFNAPNNWLQWTHTKSLKLYVHCQNALTITKYKGLDPETRSLSSLPPLRVIVFGVSASL